MTSGLRLTQRSLSSAHPTSIASVGSAPLDTALVLAASLADLLATLAYGAHLRRFSKRSGLVGLALLGLGGVLALGGLIGRLVRGTPIDLEFVFLLLAALLPLGWVGLQFLPITRRPVSLYGAFLAPVVTMLAYSLHVFDKEAHVAASGEAELVAPIHIAASLLGFLIFGVAAVCASIEVLQEYRLKTKRITLNHAWSLASIERIARMSLIIAFPIYSVGVALGAVWYTRVDPTFVTRHAVMAASSWVLFALVLYARVAFGLKGRRAAIITLAAFGMSLFVVLLSALRITG